jgi:predicted regulator of Ras-like GTPase activity (Roadblock/LC7/MglB family)
LKVDATTKVNVIAEHVKKGNLAQLGVRGGRHYVLAYAVDGERFLVNDSLYGAASYSFQETSSAYLISRK